MNEKDFPYYLPPKQKENFIGRNSEISTIDNNFKTSQIQAICSFTGAGKTTLALEYAYKLKDENTFIPRWFNAYMRYQIEMEYREFADVLDIKTETKSMKFITQKVNFLLEKSKMNILFIFDNLEEYECIEDLITGIPKNVKILITTRNMNLNHFFKIIKLDLFSYREASLYVDLNIEKHLTTEQKDQLLSIVKTKTNQILPLKLKKFFNYFKAFPLFNVDKLIENALKLKIPDIGLIYYDELLRNAPEACLILHYCSFLRLEFVSFNFLFNLCQTKIGDINEFKLHTLLNILNRFSFIESLKKNNIDGFSITHPFIQEEYRKYADQNSDKLKSNYAIAFEIAEFLSVSIDNIEVNSTLDEDVYKQTEHFLENLENENTTKWINICLHISLVEKMAHYELLVNKNTERNLYYNLKCFDLRKEALDDDHCDLLKSLNNIAVSYHNLGEYSLSLKYFFASCVKLEKIASESLELAECLNNIGQVYHELGDYKNSLEFNDKAYQMKVKVLNLNESSQVRSLSKSLCQLAISHRSVGDYKQAIQLFLQSFETLLNYFSQHSNIDGAIDLADSLSNLGKLFFDLGDFKKSLDYSFKAYEMRRKLYEQNIPSLADSLIDSIDSLATTFNSLGEYKPALEYFLSSLEMKSVLYKGDHPEKIKSLDFIGTVYHNMGKYEKSLEYCLQAYELRMLCETNPQSLAMSLQNVGIAYRNMGDQKNILDYFIKAYEVNEVYANLNSTDFTFNNSEFFADSASLFDSLDNLCEKQNAKREISSGDEESRLKNVSNINSSFDDYKLSLEYFLVSYKIRENLYDGCCHLELGESLDNIATTYNCLGEFKTALKYYQSALKIKKKLFVENHPDIANSYSNIAIAMSNMGEYKKSFKYFLKSFKIRNKLNVNEKKQTELKLIMRNVFLIYQNLDDTQKHLVGRLKSYKKLRKYFQKFSSQNSLETTSSSESSSEGEIDLEYDTMIDNQIKNKSNLTKLLDTIQKSQNCLNDIKQEFIKNV